MSEYQGGEEDLAEVMERIGKTARELMPEEPPGGYRTGFGIAPRHALMLIGRIEELEAENARLKRWNDELRKSSDETWARLEEVREAGNWISRDDVP